MPIPSCPFCGLLPTGVHDATADVVESILAGEEPERDQLAAAGVTQPVYDCTVSEISEGAKAAIDTIIDAEIGKPQG